MNFTIPVQQDRRCTTERELKSDWFLRFNLNQREISHTERYGENDAEFDSEVTPPVEGVNSTKRIDPLHFYRHRNNTSKPTVASERSESKIKANALAMINQKMIGLPRKSHRAATSAKLQTQTEP